MYICYLIIISLYKKVGPIIWTNVNPHHTRMLCAKFGWNRSNGSGEEDFWISSMHFCNFVIVSQRQGPSFGQTWIPFTQGCIVPSLVKIGPVVLEKKIFWISWMYFCYIVKNLPLKTSGAFRLKKFEFPLPKDALCQAWLKLTQWFWRRRFLILSMYFAIS